MGIFLLNSPSQKIQVVVTAATGVAIDMHASWADASGSPVSVAIGALNVHYTTAGGGTTDLVAAPAVSTSRNVKNIKISNNHATYSNLITLQINDNGTLLPLEQCTLLPGERLGYEEGVGIRVFDSSGREKSQLAPAAVEQNNVTADQTISGVDAYITGSDFNITNRLKIGSVVRWTITAAKTDTVGTTAPIYNIRVGTAGAIGDTARCIMTGNAQTAVADIARVEISAHFRVIGASAVIQAVMGGDHKLATTGMSTGGFANWVLSSAFDITPANTKMGISINPGTSAVWVVKTCSIEALALAA